MTAPPVPATVDLLVDPSDVVIAYGEFPDGLSDEQIAAGLRIETILAENAAPLQEPGAKHWNEDGTITVTPPPPPPPIYAEEGRLINRQAKTTDATPVTVGTFNLHLQTVYKFGVEVTAIADNGQEMIAEYAVAAKRLNQAAIKVGTEAVVYRVNDANTATWAVGFAVSGNGLVMTVTGVAGRTIDWLVSARIVSFTPQGRPPGTE